MAPLPSSLVPFSLLFFALLPSILSLPDRYDVQTLAAIDQSPDSQRNDLDWEWQRTGFHFQPVKNWMNDPNGPLFYKGVYHLFYQWNPYAAVWGNITWGHAVSTDLIHWKYVKELALVPDRWYDIKGVWSGSATIVNGKPILLYTGWTNSSTQVQNKAVPKNSSDPLLREWIKVDAENPFAVPPPGINTSDFRDPTTAWIGQDGLWRTAVGSKYRANDTGIILQYRSKDFAKWELLDESLHAVNGTGMWECPDFFPVAVHGQQGSENYLGEENAIQKFVIKVSLDETRFDTYVVGDYDPASEKFLPSFEALDIGTALRYDYGIYYASKSFYDPHKKRRVLLGWINEADKPTSDIRKGWASVQAIPRVVWLDENQHSLRQWPVPEINSLRKHPIRHTDLLLKQGEVFKVNGSQGSQLDIEVTFQIPKAHANDESDEFNFASSRVEGIPNNTLIYCNGSFPEAEQIIGPFGVHVLASEDLRERTSVFFKFLKFKGSWKTMVCNDLTSSSLASDATKGVYGGLVSLSSYKNRQALTMRILVDHSIVETFAQGGRTCITARSYPLLGSDNNAHIFVFNNGSLPVKATHLAVWKMDKIRYTTV
ncbi:beta-fructofuranosidase, soluble isoenzyme I [Selaginella moellendorffii]|uniref:beta-fructofuranosidase, soluble isoenzyme I n=1 Tax=Selaginella moellendorffii TaxID=88036 RepID=UPI000D1CB619|nr:beta-fructofuranosidase, soluble isoenzyme I [Selaginella moellendorffii]|eukprot:XP_024520926.1 beta-fructofuranosidase, soluble isoenzyme I [Selaginella moellendorffii]